MEDVKPDICFFYICSFLRFTTPTRCGWNVLSRGAHTVFLKQIGCLVQSAARIIADIKCNDENPRVFVGLRNIQDIKIYYLSYNRVVHFVILMRREPPPTLTTVVFSQYRFVIGVLSANKNIHRKHCLFHELPCTFITAARSDKTCSLL